MARGWERVALTSMVRVRPLLFALSLGIAAALAPIPALAGTGNISGTLHDDDTSGAAVGVTVGECGGAGCGPTAVSDGSGNYQVNGVTSGSGWNVLTDPGNCSGYAKAHKYGVTVSNGTTTTGVDMHLTKQKGAISGRVLDPGGHPVANVGLVVDNAQNGGFGFGGATSAADGTYTVSCLAAAGVAGSGSYFISAFPPNGSPYGQKVDSGIVVSPNNTTSHDVILGTGGGSISGRITCNGGNCNTAMSVLVYCENCASSANVMTDVNGNYGANNLTGGHPYDVHAIGPSGWDNAIYYGANVANGSGTVVNLSLTASGPATSGRLTGLVTDAAGAPLANCLINAFGGSGGSMGGFVEGDVYTLADGTYDTGYRLVPGNYIVFVACPNSATVKANGGNAVTVAAGSTGTANYATVEAGRPFTGGHDAVGVPAGATHAYFAEGFTGFSGAFSFHEFLAIENPGAAQMLTVKYLLASGPPITKTYALAAQSRWTINVNADVGANQQVSAQLTAPNPFVAERSMYFDFTGNITGGHNVMGATSLGTLFYFAEGYTGGGFSEYLTLMNTDPSNTANVQVTYYFNGGGAPKTVSHPVAPNSRLTVFVNDPAEAGAGQQVSMRVTSDLPILAERPMYFSFFGETGGHVIVGSPTPITHLNLAEGHVGQGFDEYLTILNPNATAANLTITYYLGSGSPVTQPITVAGNSRATVHVNDVLPPGTDSSVHIDSDQAIVVERPMYFTFPMGGWTGGHDAMAVPDGALSTTIYFAQGYVAANFAQYYTLLNKFATDANVTLTFYRNGAGPVTKTITVPANSRYTEVVNNDLAAGTENSVVITSSVALLAERPMYFAY
jgi:hypothetical protein